MKNKTLLILLALISTPYFLSAQYGILDDIEFEEVQDDAYDDIDVYDYIQDVTDEFEMRDEQYTDDSLVFAEAYVDQKRVILQDLVNQPHNDCLSKGLLSSRKSMSFTKVNLEALNPFVKQLQAAALERKNGKKEYYAEITIEAKEMLKEMSEADEEEKDVRFQLIEKMVKSKIIEVETNVDNQYRSILSNIAVMKKQEQVSNMKLKNSLYVVKGPTIGKNVCYKLSKTPPPPPPKPVEPVVKEVIQDDPIISDDPASDAADEGSPAYFFDEWGNYVELDANGGYYDDDGNYKIYKKD